MASKRQRKKRQKQARQERKAAERQAKKERQAAERQKQYEKREQAKQAERQKQAAKQKQTERKQRKKSARREWLENAFKQRVNDANEILRDFDREDIRNVLDDDYGGLLSDDDIMTKKGFFRQNVSQLTNAQLEQRISLLDSFIDDVPSYRDEAKQAKEIADKLGIVDPDNLQIFGDFMEFVRSVLGDRVEPSDVIKDIAVARINSGEDFDDIKQAFMDAYLNSDDYWDMIDQFSDRGTLI